MWSASRETCVGIPTCPQGMVVNGDRCVALPRAEPPPATIPAANVGSPQTATAPAAQAPSDDDPVLAGGRVRVEASTNATTNSGRRPSTALLWAGVIGLAVTWIPSPILSLTSNQDYPSASGSMWIPIVGPYVARSMMSPMGQSSGVGVGLLVDGIAQSVALATTAVGVIVAVVTSRPSHEVRPQPRQARREYTVLPWGSANPTEGARAGVTVVW